MRVAQESSSPEALEGERKTVTALFADIKGSTELERDLDPEEARAIVDPALKLMIDAVHRYDGYVVQSTGDGIFAMFGAPLAHEDHPQRALYAAIRMQEDLRRYGATLRERGRAPIEIRIGVNTGEVVVRAIQTAAGHAEYTPIGHTNNLASRMQTVAPTGSIATTEDTRKLCEGYFTFRSLGPTRVKGVSEAVTVHEVTGLGPLRTRLQASARRGLSRFVGRAAELEQMKRALELAKSGRGQLVAAVGEAGVGKSRLFFEFRAAGQPGCLVLETLSVSHGKASAYLPLIDLLKNYFEITPDDDARRRREKIGGKILILDRALEDTLPYLFTLLEVAESDDQIARLDPEIRRRRTLDAIKRLLLRESLHQPLVAIFEDLHWVDEGSHALLNLLAESLGTARVLMLVNYRPEFTHNWGNKTYYTQLRLDPLGAETGEEMLNALLDDGRELAPLKQLIIEKTEGNPLFIEEIVQALFEQGALVRNGAVKLAKSLNTIQIPSTVQAVLASRIDRLPAEQKDLLQTLAIIGKEFPLGLVRAVSGKSDDELDSLLAGLQTAEFIYEQPAVGDVAYVFKHALSQQVASGSALMERRRVLHERVARALEVRFPETVETQPELIAHHFTEAGLGAEAVPYWQRAGERALQRSANLEAIDQLEKGLELLGSPPDVAERSRPADEARRFALLLLLGVGRVRVGEFAKAHQAFLRAAETAKSLGSTENVISAALELVHMTHTTGFPAPEALQLLEEALQKLGPDDSPLKARTLSGLARFLGVTGERQKLMSYAPQAVAMARRIGDPKLVSYSLLGMFYALSGPEHADERLAITTEMQDLAKAADVENLTYSQHFWRGYCLLELGDTAGADEDFEAYGRWAAETNQPFHQSICEMLRAMRALMSGRFEDSERLAQNTFVITRSMQAETAAGVFGLQMFALRREQGRLKEVEPVVRMFVQQNSADAAWRPGLAVIYSELGLTADARAEFENLAKHDFGDLPRDSMWMGTLTYFADICTFLAGC
ncbi:MAG TPA: adenylate/guanylate cyclase domain-containing protein [Candidatus Binatus sp.]|uniref:ATP-binding protein n=1 Tax=Candidatus Binatus sp. TaxID=2811406 RepID=UPI002B48CA62|nr:adenylate/guanylate cyclase domain-containing protein [Candidatus Binatus sp.]HKN14590.1 adenylate/guanylate cyclase domain-containing protein [Candidatus Binatus sp.]